MGFKERFTMMWPNKSPEPTAVGACQFRCRGSRRESAVAQLFSLGRNFERTVVFEKNYEKLPRTYHCSHHRFFMRRNG